MLTTFTDAKAEYESLYYAAQVADEVFQAAVVAQFGRKQAGTMRYASALHDGATKAAAKAYWTAAAKMLDAKRAMDRVKENQ